MVMSQKYKDYSASIDHALIDIESGTTVSGTTNVSTEIYMRPKKERDKNASQLIVERHESIKHAEADETGVVHRLSENPDSSGTLGGTLGTPLTSLTNSDVAT
jgi:hypothetical protein